MNAIDLILDFLKGFVPGYAAIEKLIAPVFGSEVADYGQCRAKCGLSSAYWPAAITDCNTCVTKISGEAVVKLLPQAAGAGVGAFAFGLFWESVTKLVVDYLKEKGLTWLTTRAIPLFGWIAFVGDIANLIMLIISLKNVYQAANNARTQFCVCP